MSTARRPAALAFILITVTLDMLAFGIVIPVLPKLILDFTAGSETCCLTQMVRCATSSRRPNLS